MSVCTNCGKELQQGALICRNCGTRVVNMTSTTTKEDKKSSRRKMKASAEDVANKDVTEDVNVENVKKESKPKRTKKQHKSADVEQELLKDDVTENFESSNDYLTVGNFVVMLIIQMIPVLGFIMTIIWAVSKNNNINKRNYARATLIIQIVLILITVVLGVSSLILFS